MKLLSKFNRGDFPLFPEAVSVLRFTAILFLVKSKDKTMTHSEFITLCNEHTIDPSLALENENIVEALKARDDAQVVEVLTNEF